MPYSPSDALKHLEENETITGLLIVLLTINGAEEIERQCPNLTSTQR